MVTPKASNVLPGTARAATDKAATPRKKAGTGSARKRKRNPHISKDGTTQPNGVHAPSAPGSVSGPASKRPKATGRAAPGPRSGTRPVPAGQKAPARPSRKLSSSLAIHRGRFASWSPSAVSCGAASADGTVAAICRESGDIELWDALNWKCLQVQCPPRALTADLPYPTVMLRPALLAQALCRIPY